VTAPPREVLLVEDDEADRQVMEEALRDGQGLIALKAVGDGADALRYLRREGRFSGANRPALVLLDLNLAAPAGLEVLRAIKADPALSSIPVLVMTSSESQRHVDEAYAAGANCFLPKPSGLEQMRTLAGLLGGFWFVYAKLPSAPERP
jgi:CheY-like chemotaxis protein